VLLREAMIFMKDEAQAQKGWWVRVRTDSFSVAGIAKGMTGRVMGIYSLNRTGAGPGQVFSTGEQEEGWVVDIEFNLPNGKTKILSIEKKYYERFLEKI